MTGTTASQRVVAIGIDTQSLAEVAEGHARFGSAYERRVASAAERAALPRSPAARTERLARLWAAKEAVTKTLSPGADDPWPWPCVETGLGGPDGEVRLSGRPAELAAARGVDRVVVSPGPVAAGRATAVAIALGGTPPLPHAEGQP